MCSQGTRVAEETIPARSVGPDADCSFSNLQDAIDFAAESSSSSLMLRLSGDPEHYHGKTYEINMKEFTTLRSLIIRGGYDSCRSGATSSGRTVLDADGNDRVFVIRYDAGNRDSVRTVSLENLEIKGGDAGDDWADRGGGILVAGNSHRQTVHFRNVNITDNFAGSGGGVSVLATGASERDPSHPWVTIDNRSSITHNEASFVGGGLHCRNATGKHNSFIRVGSTLIAFNHARSGGGVGVEGCRDVFLHCGAPIVLIAPMGGIAFNTAEFNGGGLFVGWGSVVLNGLATNSGFGDPNHAALLLGNEADRGGGAFVWVSGTLLLIDTVVSGNIAHDEGGGLYLAVRSTVRMQRAGSSCQPKSSQDGPVFRVHRCSRLTGNHAHGHGGGIRIKDDDHPGNPSTVLLYQTFISGNTSGGLGSVGMVTGEDSELLMEGAVIYGNHGSSRLFQLEHGSLTKIYWSTIAGNRDPDDPPLQMFRLFNRDDINARTRLSVRGSILWEPNSTLVNRTANTWAPSRCVIGHLSLEDSGLSGGLFYSFIDPRLRDEADGDLRLSSNSPAIDYCSTMDAGTVPQFRDMFSNPRGIEFDRPTGDAPDPGNGFFDIGAHEIQSTDISDDYQNT